MAAGLISRACLYLHSWLTDAPPLLQRRSMEAEDQAGPSAMAPPATLPTFPAHNRSAHDQVVHLGQVPLSPRREAAYAAIMDEFDDIYEDLATNQQVCLARVFRIRATEDGQLLARMRSVPPVLVGGQAAMAHQRSGTSDLGPSECPSRRVSVHCSIGIV